MRIFKALLFVVKVSNIHIYTTGMHSSRMRTDRSISHLGGGGGSLSPPRPLWTEWHTPVKTFTFPASLRYAVGKYVPYTFKFSVWLMLNRFKTYFPCLLRLSFFAIIQSRLPLGGLPRICLIFSLMQKIVWKSSLCAPISQKSVDFL